MCLLLSLHQHRFCMQVTYGKSTKNVLQLDKLIPRGNLSETWFAGMKPYWLGLLSGSYLLHLESGVE